MITSSVNMDSFYALNPNFNRNANPTYIYYDILYMYTLYRIREYY